MATITLKYDGRSKIIRDLIKQIIERGAVRIDDPNGMDATLKAIKELDAGGGVICKSYDEYLQKAYQV